MSGIGLGEDTQAGELVTHETAMSLPAVWACVRILSETISSMPLHLYRRLETGDRVKAAGHPAYRLFKHAPNSFQTPLEFREFLTACVALRGNGYAFIERQDGEVVGVWPLRPERVTVETDGRRILYRYADEAGKSLSYGQDEILHLKGLTSDGLIGRSPVSTLRETVGTVQGLERYTAKFFKNSARPSGVLTHVQHLSQDQFDRLREQFDRAYSGAGNRGKTIILEDGMTWQTVGLTNEDAELLTTRKFALEDILRCFRIPPHIAGHLDKMSYNNIEQLGSEFLNLTLTPWLRRIEERLDLQILTQAEREAGLYFEHESGGLLRGSTESRFGAYKVALDAGFMTVDEIRRKENLPALPEKSAPNVG